MDTGATQLSQTPVLGDAICGRMSAMISIQLTPFSGLLSALIGSPDVTPRVTTPSVRPAGATAVPGAAQNGPDRVLDPA